MFGVQFLGFTFGVGVGSTKLCVSLTNVDSMASTSLDIAWTISCCVWFNSMSHYLKHSNYLSCARVWFSSIWKFNSWLQLIDSTRTTITFLHVTSIEFMRTIDVFLFILMLPTWCQGWSIEVSSAHVFVIFIVHLHAKRMLGPSFFGS